MKKEFFRVFFFLILLSPLGLTTLLYVECQDLYPDEWLDLFGIPNISGNVKTILTAGPTAFPFSDLIPDGHIFQRQYPETLHSQPFPSELVLPVSLRC
jgi:hypothetical protein